MAINNTDVKLYESQRLTDEEDGGGRVTGREVVDGNINNLYQDISRIDRTIGDVSLRKAFVGISTDNSDVYLGSHIVLTEAPKDPNVSVLLFNTDNQTDERKEARNRIEGYVIPGFIASWELLGNQQEGQRSLTAFQREEQALPEIGEVYQLLDTHKDNMSQYVRLTSLEHNMETFSINIGNGYESFQRRKLELGISTPLIGTFSGGTPTPGASLGDKSNVSTTQVADTSRYYGIQPLSANVSQGDLAVKVKSVYAPLVPSAKQETPLLDQYGGYTSKTMVASSASPRTTTLNFVHVTNNQSRSFMKRGALPKSISLSVDGGVFEDDGTGLFTHISGNNHYDQITVDYERGEINLYRTIGYYQSTGSATFTPATGITGASLSGVLEITNQNRGFNYTLNLSEAKPRPGTLVISYIALGKWQDLQDTGAGVLDGSGTGHVLFDTGSVSFTLDAMPDPDSAIVHSYVTQIDDEIELQTGTVAIDEIAFRHTVEKPGIKPGSVTVEYLSSGQTKKLTDQGNGLLTGDGSGAIHYAPGEMSFKLDALPDDNTEVEVSYEEGTSAGGEVAVLVDGQGVMSGTIPGAPLLPGSIQLQFLVQRQSNVPNRSRPSSNFQTYQTTTNVLKKISDDTTGGWRDSVGVIDYQTGAFTIQVLSDYGYTEYKVGMDTDPFGRTIYLMDKAYTTRTETFPGQSVTAIAQASNLSHQPHTETLTAPELTIDLLPLVKDTLLPGSLIFEWHDETYYDRDGDLFKAINSQTNAGTQVGTIDYSGGVATLASYRTGPLQTATIHAAATIGTGIQVQAVAFRTAGSPVRLGSFQLTAVRIDNGEIITANADFNGVFDTGEVQGKIDQQTGWCEVTFTDGTDPIFVMPQSVRYNTVVETSLPMDAELIGLNPVRLPPDGKVAIYRAGDIVVIGHTNSVDAATPTAGQVITLARDHQSDIQVEDSAGVALASAQYTVDREAGTVTFATPLTLEDADANALTPPLTIKERVEHMSVVSDVQINGQLSIIAPVPWDLPKDETTVSSAVVYGDLQARVHHFFTQKVWDSGEPNWTDERIGDNTTAQYNRINYPLIVTNKGAIDGKWAIIFISQTNYQVVEEKLGIIDSGSTISDCAPTNPETGVPYFTIQSEGWGSGWATGNAIRFNTDGCLAPVWLCRTVLAGQGTETNDQFTLQIRGDAD